MWVTIILQFVVPILVKLIENWLGSRGIKSELAPAKEDFLAVIERKWLLGKKRLEVASDLFDHAADVHEEWKVKPSLLVSPAHSQGQYVQSVVDQAAEKVKAGIPAPKA